MSRSWPSWFYPRWRPDERPGRHQLVVEPDSEDMGQTRVQGTSSSAWRGVRSSNLSHRDVGWGRLPGQSSSPWRASIDESFTLEFQSLLDEFTERWERCEYPGAEHFLDRAEVTTPRLAVELIYREFLLSELAGLEPCPEEYLARFPEHSRSLEKLFNLHHGFSAPCPIPTDDPARSEDKLPSAGDEIGPYVLRRELGRGSFARVFLATQSNLEDRPMVVKITTRPTREPWLLARARHANIVEILTHAPVNNGMFQLIGMPFWGGATLSAVLDHQRRVGRAKAQGRRTGRDLLEDLDAVAATEYPAMHLDRPAREIIRPLSEHRAMAWMVGRLADALDHAYARGVIHGDIKPSNVLLTADGNPMLLDFNLSREWSQEPIDGQLEGVRGTLAYMAPERLRAIGSPNGARAGPVEIHRADIYSLGLVLLEVLTTVPVTSPTAPSGPRVDRPPDMIANELAAVREQDAHAMIRRAEASSGRAIHPALRSILEQCLCGRPELRYRRALELAEDLDRWRTGRPLAYADEPYWRYTVPCGLRARWQVVAMVGVALMVAIAVTALLSVVKARESLTGMAMHRLSRLLDDPESHVFPFQRPGSTSLQNLKSAEALSTSFRALRDYDILGDSDWRQRDGLRCLPEVEREDLSLWLMEQAYRCCLSLVESRTSPGDWLAAINSLDRLSRTTPSKAFRELRGRAVEKVARAQESGLLVEAVNESADSNIPPPSASTQVPEPWFDDYLLGVAAEHAAQEEALTYFERVLARRPDSFWAHYHAAANLFHLERWSEAAAHLERCVSRRSENAILRGQLAACLAKARLLDAAIEQCELAIRTAPEQAEFYRSRAFIRATANRTEGLREDVDRFEFLRRLLHPTFYRKPPGQELGDPRPAKIPASRRMLALAQPGLFIVEQGDLLGEAEQVDREDLDFRAVLANAFLKAGDAQLGFEEIEKTLAIDADHIPSRLMHMYEALEGGRTREAGYDLDRILNDPSHHAHFRSNPVDLDFFIEAGEKFAKRGDYSDALRAGRRALALAVYYFPQLRGKAHYKLARIFGLAARTDPEMIARAAMQLNEAFHSHPGFRSWFARDEILESMRIPLLSAISSPSPFTTQGDGGDARDGGKVLSEMPRVRLAFPRPIRE